MKHTQIILTTMNTQTQTVKFIQEWKAEQFTQVHKAIVKHFREVGIITDHNGKRINLSGASFNQIDQVFGLAYTSSSSCAGLWVCNVQVEHHAGYHYQGFILGEDGNVYAYLTNEQEHEEYIQISK